MSQPGVRAFAVATILSVTILSGAGQGPVLSIVSATPAGDLDQLADAEVVRIVFSEPMVQLGTVPSDSAPGWIRITPATPGSFYWSGTRTLIFSPDASTPIPFATAFTVRVDAAATSASGRTLGEAYEFNFTTPRVRLLSANWYRKNGRFDSPAVIALRFNQRVRAADVVAHTRVNLTPHPWTPPPLPAEGRERWRGADAAGLERFDGKVTAVREVASSSAAVDVRVAGSWDENRFPPAPELAMIETTAAPPPDGWLTIALDDEMPSPEGAAKTVAHSSVVQLEPTFFVEGPRCTTGCDPSDYNDIMLTGSVALGAVSRAFAVQDITDPAAPRPVTPARSISPEVTSQWMRSAMVESMGFDSQPPARTWQLRFDAGLVASDGQRLGYPWVGFVNTAHAEPFVAFDGSVWEAAGGAQLPINVRNAASMTQWIASVPPSSVMMRLREMELPPLPPDPLRPRVRGETRRLPMAPDAVQAHGLDLRRFLSAAGTGIIWAAAAPAELLPGSVAVDTTYAHRAPTTGKGIRSELVQVTNLGITVKDSPASTLVFVTRLDTAAPVAAARVAIVDTANRTRWTGVTDGSGVALAPALVLRQADSRWDLSFIVTAAKDGDFAFVGSDWGNTEDTIGWRPDYLHESRAVLRHGVFTDRGVYRETETVHFKSIVRDDTATGMRALPAGAALDVTIHDSRQAEVDRRTVRVNRWSSAEWTWRVPAGAALGDYRITIARGGALPADEPYWSSGGRFLVAAYRRPDFRVDATLASDPPVLGSTLRAAVEASYLFGQPLAARPVHWRSWRAPVQQPPEAVRARYPEPRYAVGYLPREAERAREEMTIPDGTGTLGADGRTTLALPTAADGDVAYSYTFEGSVEDVSAQQIASRASLVVHPASLYVALSRPPMFVEAKSGANTGVVVVDLAGAPIAGVPVTVSLFREQWSFTRPPNGGALAWQRREVPAGEWEVRSTGRETPVPIALTDGGCYILRATARDASGRQTRTELTFYATGPGLSSWRSEGHKIDLTPERETWKPGETARILVQSPWERAMALVTVEREGIRNHRTVTITSTQDTVEVPITEADVPNVYVSVLLVKGRTATGLAADGSDAGQPSYRLGYTELNVDDSSKRLSVDVRADRTEYRPGQPVTVSVAVAAPDGRPVSGEVTLWAMDYGVLSLTGYTTPDVLKSIYVPKGLQVVTEDSRQRLMSRRAMADPSNRISGVSENVMVSMAGLTTRDKVFGYMSALPAPPPPPPVPQPGFEIRSDFRPLVFWAGSVTTDADGRATTTVTLPDSLTTYRIMAVAGDPASRFGFGEREIRVSKPLTLLPTFPRFLSKGDRAAFGAVITNAGSAGGEAVVTIQSLDPDMLQIGGAPRQAFRLAAGASVPVKFDAVARGTGAARVRMTVTLGDNDDAFDMPLVITEPMQPETTAAYGDTTGTATERLALPSGLLPGAGGLTVEMASTALVGLGEGARYLDEYPFDCAEQKASRALALLLASDLGGAFRLSGIKPDDYRAEGTRALRALYGYQCSGGGFALWPGQCGNESSYLTAYVLHVMKVAGTLNVTVDKEAVNRALRFLEQELKQAPPAEMQWWPVWAASQAYSAKVLAEFGRDAREHIARLAGTPGPMPVVALSSLADALAASNDRGPRYRDVVRRLTNALRVDADRAHVEEVDDAALGWLWSTNVHATAAVLDGLSRRKDDATLAAPLVRWLVAAQANGRWSTTHENAMALEAMVAYYRAFERDVPRMTATVKVGSATAGTASFTGRSTTAQQIRMSMPDLMQAVTATASPALSISRSGTGRVYYTARVQSFAPEAPQAVDRGFQVERRYEPYVKDGSGLAATAFAVGDLIRVTVTLRLRGEGRFLALTDPLPAGVEPVEGWFQTTASDLAREATRTNPGESWSSRWRRGTFDHVEKHDDRVVAFATRLGSGTHEFSYLVRATTAGTFGAAGARVEAIYAPELLGRSQAAMVSVK